MSHLGRIGLRSSLASIACMATLDSEIPLERASKSQIYRPFVFAISRLHPPINDAGVYLFVLIGLRKAG